MVYDWDLSLRDRSFSPGKVQANFYILGLDKAPKIWFNWFAQYLYRKLMALTRKNGQIVPKSDNAFKICPVLNRPSRMTRVEARVFY